MRTANRYAVSNRRPNDLTEIELEQELTRLEGLLNAGKLAGKDVLRLKKCRRNMAALLDLKSDSAL